MPVHTTTLPSGKPGFQWGHQKKYASRAAAERQASAIYANGWKGDKFANDVEWNEADHPRGQPENAGQFGPGVGGAQTQGLVQGRAAAKSSSRVGYVATTVRDGKRVLANGDPLPSHIIALKIPPAWTDVKVSSDPRAALQVVGRDVKGRRQAIYSAAHFTKQSVAKFARIEELSRKYTSIMLQNEQNRASGDDSKRELADCMKLVMVMGLRPGSDSDTKAKVKAYGATTLLGHHVTIDGNEVRLRFIGKKGVAIDLPVTDPEIRDMLIKHKAKVGDEGQLFKVDEKSLLNYAHTFDGGGFKTKDFRTLVGTRTAMQIIAATKPPEGEKGYRQAVMSVAKAVAARLGNTPVVALQSYISPSVFAHWRLAA